ncbi:MULTISPECIES: electron transfer flavoprotein subunit beta/FixA family protein [Raoultella]|jgi:electron transfer flavoprotein beta subunit|uniref:electron transfer flavoprotein subunit beta/FixA family protein n=1 Tax=Raoultella TaxID=160674 RepID=UPI000976EF62|nr:MULTISPECIES: electron transfer flavoprotein subunit beta/FixA family protein [Raoultella]MCS4274051.1 electron transfer flavoprotein beta subunit [Raoultella sp. BIGb0132]MCS4290913.1 electron transfer flavoprotein beta subunit [Raoultella terrigena]OMP95631.1 electron transfer flavoprotein subunit beta [Raoultella terrigena]
MKVLIPIKRVVDHNVKIRVKSDGSQVDLTNAKMALNPFCEIAVEEAIRLKELGIASEIVVVTIGDDAAQEQLRSALAMGADRGLLITTAQPLEPLNLAKVLAKVVAQEQPSLILMGKQSIDGDNNQTGQMLAALCGYPQGTFAAELRVENGQAIVTREIDGGLQIVSLTLPAIITTDLRLNQPRYTSLPNMMKAKKKPLSILPVEEFGLELRPHTALLRVEAPPTREAGVRVDSVDELLNKLKNEAKVI